MNGAIYNFRQINSISKLLGFFFFFVLVPKITFGLLTNINLYLFLAGRTSASKVPLIK